MPRVYEPIEFRYEEPPTRLIGLEMEYHIQCGEFSSAAIAEGLKKQGIACASGFTSNGARVYPDLKHIEYATPECLGPWQATAADHAGMIIINKLVQDKITASELSGKEALPALRVTGSYDPNPDKDNVPFKSKGYHENYITPTPDGERRDIFKQVATSFLTTRMIWNGNGLVAGKYLLSQKAPGIGETVLDSYGSRCTHGKKPLAGLLSDKDKVPTGYSLLEVRHADSHMSRFCTFVGLAATSGFLRLLEQGIINSKNADDYILRSPRSALHALNNNFARDKLQLASGKTTTALSLQTRLAEDILELAGEVKLPQDEILGAEELLKTCQALKEINPKNPDPSSLVRRIEWAAKYCLLQRKFGDDMLGSSLDNAMASDRQWHSLNDRVDDKQADKWKMLDPYYDKFESEIDSLMEIPPFSRAFARGAAIETGKCQSANWNTISMKNIPSLKLYDPYDPELPSLYTQAA